MRSFLISIFILILPVATFAQDYTADLEPIVVSANRSSFSMDHTAQSMSVYTQDDLQNLPAQNLADALSYMPGVSIDPTGPMGQASSVSMRGASSRQVLVMVDGIPFNNQLSGQANLSEIPLADIDRIEVIRGGDSSAWGSSLGGVINVITKSTGVGQKPQATLTSEFGSYGETKNSLDVSGGIGNFGFISMGSFLHSGGNLADSLTQETKNYTKVSYILNDAVKFNASYGYSGSNLNYGPTEGLIFKQPYITRYGQANLQLDKGESHWQLAYKYNDQTVSLNTFDSTSGEIQPSYSPGEGRDLYQGISIVGTHQINADNVLTTGSDFDWHTIKYGTYLSKAEIIATQSPFINDVWTIGDFDIEPGVRFDNNSRFGDQLSPSLGGVYHLPWDEASFKLRASRVFNAPPLLWIYNNNPSLFVAPNPNLKAERAISYDAGFSFKPIKPLTVSLEGYYSDVKDGLEFEFDQTTFTGSYVNVDKIRRDGGQVRFDYEISEPWSVYTSGEFNNPIDLQTKSLVRDESVSREAFKWGTHYKTNFGFGANWEGYYSRSLAAPSQANDRKPIFDLKLTQDFKNIYKNTDLELFFNLHNIANSKYWLDPSFPYPGRYVEGGFSLTF